ncbi:trifunctional purine biosynthetic protein adenosine-3-like [Sceloporus undulatus]|uniref:trifunctional purine biosynthetic protein adenosine-3-like n=1 Tax=Sceloporus undulatus TaxID=8520 RepID=UPI001C4CE0A6|nr:trifunctional purine biosynthetic protein adenosine-3-like [Sceloporus undulatus]
MADRVLVIGSGGREHALAWKLSQSPHVKQVLVAPGNAGTANDGKISNSAVLISNHTILAQFCKDHNIGFVIAGPEATLAAGIIDDLITAGVRCFGPTAQVAQLGTDRHFCKVFLDQHEIPTARWKAFSSSQEACIFINNADFPALVVKPSGFGPRKEVILASNKEAACKATRAILQDNIFGDNRETIIIEELLKGEEFSFLCFVDGVTFASMPPVQVQKQLLDGDQGPSPVGMGAYGPVPQVPEVLLQKIKSTLLQHIIDCLKQEGMSYVGVLQIELILTKDGVKVLSMDCNFGDPQCQVVLRLLNHDLYEVIQAAINSRLCDATLTWPKNLTAVSVVMACEGYRECYNKNTEITGLLQAKELGLEIFHGATIIKNDKVLINGSRVLTVTAIKQDLMSALEEAYKGLEVIYFQDAIYRKDVGFLAMKFLGQSVRPLHEDKIADFISCSILVHPSKLPAASSSKSGSHEHQRGTPAFFDLGASGYIDPILVSQTKGIGTKQKIAQLCNKHDTIGQDLVAMCVNDILAQGAEPLFFLDHFAYGKLDAGVSQVITEGIAGACELAGCHLLARETSEMSGTWAAGEYNLVGFAVGAVDRRMRLPQQEKIASGDVLIGIASSGLHSQGFNLVRKIILASSPHYLSSVPSGCGSYTLGEQLLTPSKIYSKALLPLFHSGNVKACIHIAERGLMGSFSKILPEKFSIILDAHHWKIPSVFSWLQEEGNLSEREMMQTFNCGIGAVLVVQKELAGQVLKDVQKYEDAWLIGKVIHHISGYPQVEIKNLLEVLLQTKHLYLNSVSAVDGQPQNMQRKSKVKVAVLISGTEPASSAQIVLVIADRSGVEELKNATLAGIPTRVIDHKLYGSRSEYDGTIDRVLNEFSVELICLARFTRVLSSNFLRKWNGKILGTYPSLSHLTRGGNAHKLAYSSTDKTAGCTVYFVLEDTSLEAVILREPAYVMAEDTQETLLEKVKEAESRAFPIALQLVASGMVRLAMDRKTY